MNCVAEAIRKTLNLDIYEGVGHREPIHFSEIIAFLLSKGYATVPCDDDYNYPGVLEGRKEDGSPHMVPIGEPLAAVDIKWYFIPTPINEEYARRYNETIRMAISAGRIPLGTSCSDG